jgi:hypothetical protein
MNPNDLKLWNEAEKHLYEMKKAYEEIGFVGSFGLSLVINPAVKRFESGERTQDLFDEIMNIN